MMNVELALDETEQFLNQNKEGIPNIVYTYLVDVVKQDRDYVQLVKSLSTESYSDKKKRMESSWKANNKY